MSFVWTFPGGKAKVKTITLTVAAPNGNIQPYIGKRYIVMACGIQAAALAANRTAKVFLYDGTNMFRLTADTTIQSNVDAMFNLGQCLAPLIIDRNNYIRFVTDLTGTDSDHIGWIWVLESDV